MLSPNSYSQFITKYPVFADPAFGGSAAFAEAYSLASAYVGYWENIGLNWLGFKQTAIDYKTACELQNRYDQKSGSLASISDNLKALLLEQQLGDRFLYSHE